MENSVSNINSSAYMSPTSFVGLLQEIEPKVTAACNAKKPSQDINVTSILLVMIGTLKIEEQHVLMKSEVNRRLASLFEAILEYMQECLNQPPLTPYLFEEDKDATFQREAMSTYLSELGKVTPLAPGAVLKDGEKPKPNWTYAFAGLAHAWIEKQIQGKGGVTIKELGEAKWLAAFLDIYSSPEGYDIKSAYEAEGLDPSTIDDLMKKVPYEQVGFAKTPNFLHALITALKTDAKAFEFLALAALMHKRQSVKSKPVVEFWWM
jgi:hypothetical protein